MLDSFALIPSVDKQNGVTPWRCVVIISWGNFSVFVSQSNQFQNLRFVLNFDLDQTINKNFVVDLLKFKLMGLTWTILRKNKKIHHFFIVDFQHGAWNHVIVFVSIENLLPRINQFFYKVLGMMPNSVSSFRSPNMVWVLPEPVWP